MKITKTQSLANRAHIVETASELFRERGYDGVGVAELMATAGFTQGGFYKHFGSKADLMAEAAENSLAKSLTSTCDLDLPGFVNLYVSRDHRDGRGVGCTMAALCGDAARQSNELKATFADGLESTLAALEEKYLKGLDTIPQGGQWLTILDGLANFPRRAHRVRVPRLTPLVGVTQIKFVHQ